MAKKRHRGHSNKILTVERDTPALSLPKVFRPLDIPRAAWRQVEDRRTFHPEGQARPARSFRGTRHTLIAAPQKAQRSRVVRRFAEDVSLREAIGFLNPARVLVCARRKVRREVLHALKLVGRGRGSRRPKRRSYYSDVEC